MISQNGIKPAESAHHCNCGCYFSDLPETTRLAFEAIVQVGFYPQGALLFREGQSPHGVFILCSGRAKLSISASNGKSLMRIAGPGGMLGLSAIVANRAYEGSAEMMESGNVNFVPREAFLNFLRLHEEASLRAAQHLSLDYYAVNDQVRSLALSDSVAEKFAHLLLSWCNRDGQETEHGIHLKLSLTHVEIAQMIGVSRETVTRLFSELKSKRVIQLKGSSLFVQNRSALESMVNP